MPTTLSPSSSSATDLSARDLWTLVAFSLPLIFYAPVQIILDLPDHAGVRGLAGLFTAIATASVLFTRRSSLDHLDRRLLTVLAGLWAAGALTATFMADSFGYALARQLEWFGVLLFGIAIITFVGRDHSRGYLVLGMVLFGALLIAFNTATSWALALAPRETEIRTLISPYWNIRPYGYVMLAGAMAANALLVQRDARWRIAGIGIASLFWSYIAWTGGRAAFASGLLATLVVVALLPKSRRMVFAALASLSVMTGSLLSTFFWTHERGGGLFRIWNSSTQFEAISDLSPGRAMIWNGALQKIAELPWFGKGPDGYIFIYPRILGAEPHNFLIQFAIEWGLPTAFLFTALLGYLGWKALGMASSESDSHIARIRIVAFAGLIGLSAHGFFSGVFYQAQGLILLATFAGLALIPTAGSGCPSSHPQRTAQAISLALTCFFALHLTVYLAANVRPFPSPDSWRVKLVTAVPVTTSGVDKWIWHWREEYPEEAYELADWAAERAPSPIFMYFERLKGQVKVYQSREPTSDLRGTR